MARQQEWISGTLNTGLTLCSQNCLSAYTVYPNPAKDYLTIKFDNTESADVLPERIVLYSEKSTIPALSVSVQEIYNKKEFKGGDKIELDVRELPRGTYYLHVIPKEGTEQKIEKIRIILE